MFAFIAASAAILLTPGPTNTLLAAGGATLPLRKAFLLPLAEALGYGLAVSGFFLMARGLQDRPEAFVAVKLAAAAWLVYAAVTLWRTRLDAGGHPPRLAFGRVLATTLVNPKALLVGVVFIPQQPFSGALAWIGAYAGLSILAGIGWVFLGSLLPGRLQRHSYKGAALVLTGFSLAAVASAVAS
ncbi:MAG: threonine transporter [Rhizobiales bacterium]|nr:threonine transporter [Hyphomicrobiales bacterium]